MATTTSFRIHKLVFRASPCQKVNAGLNLPIQVAVLQRFQKLFLGWFLVPATIMLATGIL